MSQDEHVGLSCLALYSACQQTPLTRSLLFLSSPFTAILSSKLTAGVHCGLGWGWLTVLLLLLAMLLSALLLPPVPAMSLPAQSLQIAGCGVCSLWMVCNWVCGLLKACMGWVTSSTPLLHSPPSLCPKSVKIAGCDVCDLWMVCDWLGELLKACMIWFPCFTPLSHSSAFPVTFSPFYNTLSSAQSLLKLQCVMSIFCGLIKARMIWFTCAIPLTHSSASTLTSSTLLQCTVCSKSVKIAVCVCAYVGSLRLTWADLHVLFH